MSQNPDASTRKSRLLDSLEQQPFRTVLEINLLALIYPYVIVTIISLYFAPFDFELPLKLVFAASILSNAFQLTNDFWVALAGKNLEHLWKSGERIVFQIVVFVSSVGSLTILLTRTGAIGDLRTTDSWSRLFMTLAVLFPLLLTTTMIIDVKKTLTGMGRKLWSRWAKN